ITIGATALVCLAYAALLFFGKDLLSYVPSFIGWAFIKSIVRPLLIIWVYIVASKLLENVSILGAIGQNTLYLCGSEYIIKKLFGDLLLVFGLSQNYSNPMTTYLCSALLLLVLYKYFVPLEKKFFAWIYQLPSKFTAGD
ncbi:MAG: hypothetical protein J6R94_00195, partial [Agathobacter sp.]|nr:hypothetical protein [Agathobacter sp.]